jgi:hypothetical protein
MMKKGGHRDDRWIEAAATQLEEIRRPVACIDAKGCRVDVAAERQEPDLRVVQAVGLEQALLDGFVRKIGRRQHVLAPGGKAGSMRDPQR